MSGLFSIQQADKVPVLYNINSIIDTVTGYYVPGADGHSILVGGLGPIVSVAGGGNSNKTEIILAMNLKMLENYGNLDLVDNKLTFSEYGTRSIIYDSENTLKYTRIANAIKNIINKDVCDYHVYSDHVGSHIRLVQSKTLMLDELFEFIKAESAERAKSRAKGMKLPMLDMNTGEPTYAKPNIAVVIDSITESHTKSMEDKFYVKEELGKSGQNMVNMRDGLEKSNFLGQLSNVSHRGNINMLMVAHLGKDAAALDPMTPSGPKLAFTKHGRKTKGVPEKFGFINDLLLEIEAAGPLLNSDKTSLFPVDERDRRKDVKPLMRVQAMITRNKSGVSGRTIEMVVQQGRGVDWPLSEYYMLREDTYWGMTGPANGSHCLDIYPEVKITRTTIRGLLRENARLRRALDIQARLYMEPICWDLGEDSDLYCTPAELYDDIKKLGYDWSILLDTTPFWYPDEFKKVKKPYLSLRDLLRMRKGLFHPKWYGKKPTPAKTE